jgi:hypothetical protein
VTVAVLCGSAMAQAGIASARRDDRLTVARQGDRVLLRSALSATHDLVLSVGRGSNGQFNFEGAYLVAPSTPFTAERPPHETLFHNSSDDAAPWHVNGTYIGGNHGALGVLELISAGHGLGKSDVGTSWRDGAGRPLHLVSVVSPDKLWFLGENTGAAPIWKFETACTGPTLTRPVDGATVSFTGQVETQLRPGIHRREDAILVDGARPLRSGETVSCAFLDLVEEYDIVNPGAILADVIAHAGEERRFTAGHLDAFVRNRIVYRFHPNGATVVDYRAKALQDFDLYYMGFIQSARLSFDAGRTLAYYIPKTRPFTWEGKDFDFGAIQDYTGLPPSAIYFGAAHGNVSDPDNLPDRFIQLLGDQGATAPAIGYALGYSLIRGCTRPEVRAANAGIALMLHPHTAKSYPRAIDEKMGPRIRAGTEFHCVAYRQYFDPAAHPNATCVYWYPEGEDVVLHADYHRSVERDVLRLPAALAGKRIDVIEKTPSLVLHTGTVVPASGLTLSVRDGYGTMVLRLQ